MKHFRDLVLSTLEPKLHNVLWIKPVPKLKGAYRIYMYEDGWVPLYGGGESPDDPVLAIQYINSGNNKIVFVDRALTPTKYLYPGTYILNVVDYNTRVPLSTTLTTLLNSVQSLNTLVDTIKGIVVRAIVTDQSLLNPNFDNLVSQYRSLMQVNNAVYIFVNKQEGVMCPWMALIKNNEVTKISFGTLGRVIAVRWEYKDYLDEGEEGEPSWKLVNNIIVPVGYYQDNTKGIYIVEVSKNTDESVLTVSYDGISNLSFTQPNGDTFSVRQIAASVTETQSMQDVTTQPLVLKTFENATYAKFFKYSTEDSGYLDNTYLLKAGDIITTDTGACYLVETFMAHHTYYDEELGREVGGSVIKINKVLTLADFTSLIEGYDIPSVTYNPPQITISTGGKEISIRQIFEGVKFANTPDVTGKYVFLWSFKQGNIGYGRMYLTEDETKTDITSYLRAGDLFSDNTGKLWTVTNVTVGGSTPTLHAYIEALCTASDIEGTLKTYPITTVVAYLSNINTILDGFDDTDTNKFVLMQTSSAVTPADPNWAAFHYRLVRVHMGTASYVSLKEGDTLYFPTTMQSVDPGMHMVVRISSTTAFILK